MWCQELQQATLTHFDMFFCLDTSYLKSVVGDSDVFSNFLSLIWAKMVGDVFHVIGHNKLSAPLPSPHPLYLEITTFS